ncbi:protein SFI1 homolog isoform X2 [Ascaphus truei]|uniref:protein SFI1 homolog isoform X2 n=1 Tax=Ascaphus truei TaxID=8439 RepID=UPI003F5A67AF
MVAVCCAHALAGGRRRGGCYARSGSSVSELTAITGTFCTTCPSRPGGGMCSPNARRNTRTRPRRATTRVLCRAWHHWRIYVKICRTKRHMLCEALEFREHVTLRGSWHGWMVQLQRRRAARGMESLALKHWAVSLQIRAWLQWRELYLQTEEEKLSETRAVMHHRSRKLRTSLRAWLLYIHYRRAKQHQHNLAVQLYRDHLTQRYFSDWRGLLERLRCVRAVQERCDSLATRCVLRRTFTHWKHYMLMCSEETCLQDVADTYHRLLLLRLGWRTLRQNVTRIRVYQRGRILAAQQRHVTLLRSSWAAWKSRLEQKEEEQHLSLTLAAHAHYRSALMQKSFSRWLQYKQKSRVKQVQHRAADRHYAKSILPRSFHIWRKHQDLQRQSREMDELAADFNRSSVQRRVLLVWRKKLNEQRENRLAERLAILHSDWRLTARFWCTWRDRLEARLTERDGDAVAAQHCSRRRLLSALCTWRENAQAIREQRASEEEALRYHCQGSLRKAWHRWRRFVSGRREEWKRHLHADLQYRHCLLARVLGAWKRYHKSSQSILRHVAEKEKQRDRSVLRTALCTWRRHGAAQAEERRQEAQAAQCYRTATLAQVLGAWRDTACVRAHHREQQAAAVRQAAACLQRGRVRCLFLYWRELAHTTRAMRVKMEAAAMHHGRRLLKDCVRKWKVCHVQGLRKLLLQRQGARLLGQRLCRSCLRRWHQMLVEKQTQDAQTVQSLWHWSLTLQGKVFDGWLGYVWERRRKKGRLTEAVEVYRADLLQDGVTRILRYMSGMKQFRAQLMTQNQVKEVYTQHLAVHRCAMIWKEKALRRKPRPPRQKRVTFRALEQAEGAVRRTPAQGAAPGPVRGKASAEIRAGGEPVLSTICESRSQRLKPRTPDFLRRSLERGGMLSEVLSSCSKSDHPELDTSHQTSALKTSLRKEPTPPGEGFPAPPPHPASIRTHHTPPGEGFPAPPPHPASIRTHHTPPGEGFPAPTPHPASTRTSHSEVTPAPAVHFSSSSLVSAAPPPFIIPHPAAPIPELMPPSSFMSRADTTSRLPHLAEQPGSVNPLCSGVQSDYSKQLLSPSDFLQGTKGLTHDTAGYRKQMDERLTEKRQSADLETELVQIKHVMQRYQNQKQDLKAWRRQAGILRGWLETSDTEQRPDEQSITHEVHNELQQLELQMEKLAHKLAGERTQVRSYITRIQEITDSLGSQH